ncbi:hypothetical protein D3C81_537040 [compost metagenome]
MTADVFEEAEVHITAFCLFLYLSRRFHSLHILRVLRILQGDILLLEIGRVFAQRALIIFLAALDQRDNAVFQRSVSRRIKSGEQQLEPHFDLLRVLRRFRYPPLPFRILKGRPLQQGKLPFSVLRELPVSRIFLRRKCIFADTLQDFKEKFRGGLRAEGFQQSRDVFQLRTRRDRLVQNIADPAQIVEIFQLLPQIAGERRIHIPERVLDVIARLQIIGTDHLCKMLSRPCGEQSVQKLHRPVNGKLQGRLHFYNPPVTPILTSHRYRFDISLTYSMTKGEYQSNNP